MAHATARRTMSSPPPPSEVVDSAFGEWQSTPAGNAQPAEQPAPTQSAAKVARKPAARKVHAAPAYPPLPPPPPRPPEPSPPPAYAPPPPKRNVLKSKLSSLSSMSSSASELLIKRGRTPPPPPSPTAKGTTTASAGYSRIAAFLVIACALLALSSRVGGTCRARLAMCLGGAATGLSAYRDVRKADEEEEYEEDCSDVEETLNGRDSPRDYPPPKSRPGTRANGHVVTLDDGPYGGETSPEEDGGYEAEAEQKIIQF